MVVSELNVVCQKLKSSQDILILTHKNPDGDTLGSGFALYYALRDCGINSQVVCSDDIPKKYEYLADDYEIIENFSPKLVVTVDIAAKQLLGDKLDCYADKIDVCIDHHVTTDLSAKYNYINSKSASNCENIYDVCECMGVTITPKIAECLYTGVSTDTGCFKFSNTTARTHFIAAKIMQTGFDYKTINKEIFETKSKGRIELETTVINAVEFYHDGKVAVIVVPRELVIKTQVEDSEIDSISAIPRQIEGVQVGITLKEKLDGYKVSVRTASKIRANEICAEFGGGGHKRAAGCFIAKTLDEAKALLINTAIKAIDK